MSENFYKVPPVLTPLTDLRLPLAAYLAAVIVGLVIGGGVIAALLTI